MTKKVKNFLSLSVLIFLFFSQNAGAAITQKQKAQLEKVITKYNKGLNFSYDANYEIKCFDCDSAIAYHFSVLIQDRKEDSIFGSRFFYKASKRSDTNTLYKYYDGKTLQIVNGNTKVITTYDPTKGQTSPINGTFDGVIIHLNKNFSLERVAKMLSRDDSSVLVYDTIIDKQKYLAHKTFLPETEEYKNRNRVLYINLQTNLIERMSYYTAYMDQAETKSIIYRNIKQKSVDSVDLARLYERTIAGGNYQYKKYEPRKVDTFMLGDSMPLLNGKIYPDNMPLSIDYSKKIVLLDFWYTSCMPCIKAIPILNQLYDKYKMQVDFYGVNPLKDEMEKPEKIAQFLNRTPMLYPILLSDEGTESSLKIIGFPTIYIIDKKGKLVYQEFGFREDNMYETLDKVLASLVGR